MRDAVVGATETRMDIGNDLAWSAGHDEPRVSQLRRCRLGCRRRAGSLLRVRVPAEETWR